MFLFNSLETDFKYENKFKVEILNSPIVTEKSFNFDESSHSKEKTSLNLLSKFSAKKTNKFSKNFIETENNDDIVPIEEEKVEVLQVKSEFNSSNKQIGKSIIEDIQKLSSSNPIIVAKCNQNIKSNKKNTNKARNQNENSNIRPISDFFKNYEYNKSSVKLNK